MELRMRVLRRHPDTHESGHDDRAVRPTFVLEDRWSVGDVAVATLGVGLALLAIFGLVSNVPGWAWLLAGWILIVTVVAIVPPRRDRVERVVETH
jgi:hypothetical protein